MARRAHGEGTIHQLPSGSWRVQITDRNGKRISHTEKKKSDLLRWLREKTGQLERGMTYGSAKVTVGEYMNRWIASKHSSLRPATYDHYKLLIETRLIPGLGNVPVNDLQPDQVQDFYDRMLRDGVGVHTVIKAHAVLHAALERATMTGLAYRNAAALAVPPKAPEKELEIWSEEEALRFLQAAHGNRLYALFHLALVTGMRQMELCGLKWSDLDWHRQELAVQRQLERKGPEKFGPLKTHAGRRTIRLGSRTMSVLQDHLELQAQERRLQGVKWQDHNLIFTSTTGTPLHHKNLVDRYYYPLIEKAGIPKMKFHGLRHFAISWMMRDASIIEVSRYAGHSRPTVTGDIYGHIPPGSSRIAEIMDDLFDSDLADGTES